MALAVLIDRITRTMDYVLGVFLDSSAAFDTADDNMFNGIYWH